MGKDIDLLEKAKNYAFLLLKFRLRSEKEVYQRLKNKKFSQEIIHQTLSFLKDKHFIDDNIFAKTWAESRLRRNIGLRRLRKELKLKGIDNEIIENQIEQIKADYPEQDLVTKIARERLNKLKNIEPQKAKRRLYEYLLRRGFSPDIVMDVVQQL